MLKAKSIISVLFILPMLICSSCQAQPDPNKSTSITPYYQFIDDTEQKIMLQKNPEKVVALVGSYAETWLLAGGKLCGITDDAMTENRIPTSQSVEVVGSLHKPDLEKILSLEPDFIILSPKIPGQLDIRDGLNKAGIPAAYFTVENFDDYLHMLSICTDITGDKQLFTTNGLAVQEKINQCLAEIPTDEHPTILLIRTSGTAIAAKSGDDNFASVMLKQFGTVNIADQYPSLLKDLSMEEIIQQDPDYIFVIAMGDMDKAMESLKNQFLSNPAWNNLKAVKNNQYYVLPKELFQLKPNAKWSDSYEYLQKILYPTNS